MNSLEKSKKFTSIHNEGEENKCDLCDSPVYLSKKVMIEDPNKNSNGKSFNLNYCRCGFRWINLRKLELNCLYNKAYFERDVYRYGYINEESYIRNKAKIFKQELIQMNYNDGAILDIGCGFGYFLDEFDSKNWDRYGIDISKYAVDRAKNLLKINNIYCIDVTKNVPFRNNKLDVVVLIDTLEHIPRPFSLIKEINRILKVGGLLYIYTYNFNGLGRFIYDFHWREFYPPYHCNYFNKKSIRYGTNKSGFTIKSLKTKGLSYYGDYYGPLINKALKILSKMATLFNIGDNLELIAYKNKSL
jgi:SAM-dependent methyltransferase